MIKADRSLDIIVYGATSFVGQILTKYLAEYQKSDKSEGTKWAIAGRSQSKLDTLKAQLNLDNIETIVANADDEQALNDMAKRTKVVITTVGPYALYGETMVRVCANTGTDYCDLTGEPQWIHSMIVKYEAQAKASGARIIHSSGFDSIPSDLGVYVTQQTAIEKTGSPAQQIKMRVRKIKGAASGGTVASMLNVFKETKENPELRKVLVNPYVLCPPDHPYKLYQKNHTKAQFDPALKIWTMPFVMAAINERIVHRTNALLEHQYGSAFQYDEAMSAKTGFQAWTFTLGLGAFFMAASITPLRHLLAKYVLPKPGEGPSPEAQLSGMFDMRFYASLPSNDTASSGTGLEDSSPSITVKVLGDRDPGYGSTGKMLAQVGLSLVSDIPNLAGGFWTPASALNQHLITRLAEHAGVTIEVLS